MSGRLLVATPRLVDPHFHRTVVLLLDHGPDGALGVVLNRILPVAVDSVLPGWQEVTSSPGGLFQGGPVGLDGAIGVAVGVAVGGGLTTVDPMAGPFGLVDLDSDPDELVGKVDGLRIFAGHAGWSGGQLEEELDERAWFVVDAEPADAYTPEPDTLWRRVLRRQGGELAIVANYPPDISMN
ncbi:UPF0301 protein [Cellulomonas composti]|uniref:UPF0301 protein n=2 Tax=Cellulomonas composti TaxID=266130 RepID=A0A511JDC9_9CELL|nr:UPF0301 protein [Cellulomonas composti]